MSIKQYIKAQKNIKEVKYIFGEWVKGKPHSETESELRKWAIMVIGFRKFGYYKLSRYSDRYYKACRKLNEAWQKLITD